MESASGSTADVHPGCTHKTRPEIDPKRVKKALSMEVERGENFYDVHSTSGSVYRVTLEPVYSCECRDAIYRDAVCKHIVACLAINQDEEVLSIAKRYV